MGFPSCSAHAAYYRDAGRTEYYEKARCLLEDLERIDASFNTARNKPKGHLRIAIGGSTACDVLIPLLADFMTSWPDIRIDLQVPINPRTSSAAILTAPSAAVRWKTRR
ncbi:LysR family transcriptional regulator [Klebsiella pneumoniae]|uniref:LysR family transcriptional regulator n=1 Tax=Klebsiella pneumoniae TaxID=573 RepID=A0A2X1Q2L4_KLEPN|nr:LysR family transcriptional regulator [Klebsiella pneumoniae]